MLDRRMLLRAGSAAVGGRRIAHRPATPVRPSRASGRSPASTASSSAQIEITRRQRRHARVSGRNAVGRRAEDARGRHIHVPSRLVRGLQINTTLVNTGDKLVLIDAGWWRRQVPENGRAG